MSAFDSFFNGDYMPHGHSYLWQPEILWMNVISDSLIALAYFSIPFVLYYINKHRKDWQFDSVFILFSGFIFMCGVTHIMGIVTIWQGVYGLHGISKLITAIVSIITAVVLLRLLPKILAIPTANEIKSTSNLLIQKKVNQVNLNAINENKRLLEKSLDASPIGLLALDVNGKISAVNQAVCLMFGFSKDEIKNQPISFLFNNTAEELKIDSDFILEQLQAHGSDFNYSHPSVYQAKTQNNHLLPIEIKLSGDQMNHEQVIFVSIADQSLKIQAEQTESHLTAIFDSCDDPIIGCDLDGTITQWNNAAEKLYGYSPNEITGQPITNIVDEQYIAQVYITLDKLLLGEKIDHYETIRIKKDGSKVPVIVTISPIKDRNNNIIGSSVIDKDCTELKRSQQELQNKNKALEDSNKELESFTFIASHDLKEPLRKIMSFGQLIEPEIKSLASAQNQEFFGYMLSAADRMQLLLDSLLSYTHLSSKAKPFEAVDLNIVMQEVMSDLSLKIDEADAQITCDKLPVIHAEKAQIRQLFQNLLDNALKYRKKDTNPIIKVINKPSTSYSAHLVFSDNGIGFEQKHAQQIFEMFKRLHGRTVFQGTGVGLAICRKIVERHGGLITADSINGEGASFELHLP